MSNLKVIFKMFKATSAELRLGAHRKDDTEMQILLGNCNYINLFYTFTIEIN